MRGAGSSSRTCTSPQPPLCAPLLSQPSPSRYLKVGWAAGELRTRADRSQPLQGETRLSGSHTSTTTHYQVHINTPGHCRQPGGFFFLRLFTKQITLSEGNSCNKIVTISQLVNTVMLYLQHIKINPLRASSTCLNLLFSAMFQLDILGGKIHF